MCRTCCPSVVTSWASGRDSRVQRSSLGELGAPALALGTHSAVHGHNADGRPCDRRRQNGLEAIESRRGRVRRGSDGLRQPADHDHEGPEREPGSAAGAAEYVKLFDGGRSPRRSTASRSTTTTARAWRRTTPQRWPGTARPPSRATPATRSTSGLCMTRLGRRRAMPWRWSRARDPAGGRVG
jgi:hypothetical protein